MHIVSVSSFHAPNFHRRVLFLMILLATACLPARAQNRLSASSVLTSSPGVFSSSSSGFSSWFFPKNFIRGYTEFAVAPPHNEPDLGRCNQPQPTCSAFARYIISGYLEIQPFARSPLKRLYFFYEPRFFFGDNIPQVSYTASMAPLAMDRLLGIGIVLPRHFELRVSNHATTSFSPFDHSLGPYDSGPNKQPLGIYTTIAVRWYFGGYDHSRNSW